MKWIFLFVALFLIVLTITVKGKGTNNSGPLAYDTTGVVTTVYSGKQKINCHCINDTTCYLRDLSNGKKIITLSASGNDFISRSLSWDLTGSDQYALDVHYGVSRTWRFYKEVFGRNGIDDAGSVIYSYVNDPNHPDNAVWDGKAMRFGAQTITGKIIAAPDIIGHELTHAFIAKTCRLHTGGESGAINESICDIMGKSIQFWSDPSDSSWVYSDKMDFQVRDMSNPPAFRQPSTYKDSVLWYRGYSDDKNDHTNSGVGNYMFYLLVKGGQGKNANGKTYRVKPIGLAAADSIIYRAAVMYLAPAALYCDWKEACIQAALDLFGKNSIQVQTVRDAWNAVGVPSCDEIYNKQANHK